MKKGKFQKNSGNKMLALVLALTLLVGGAIGGTVAWLMDKTDEIKNTFTTSDVDIELAETKPTQNTAKMIPGYTIEKDPTVTVKADSEACYVFVKIDKSANYDEFMEHAIADGWTTATEGVPANVIWRVVEDTDADQSFGILKGNIVTVKDSVTKEMMDDVTANPTLTFTAYAIQLNSSNGTPFDVADAWAKINPPTP